MRECFSTERVSQDTLPLAHPDLSPEQRTWFDSAAGLIDNEFLYRLNREITAIHSPTGRERVAMSWVLDPRTLRTWT
jgi:hypothetical protein